MAPQYWQAIAAFVAACAALYGIVTAPLLRTLKAEISASEERMKALITATNALITTSESRTSLQLADMEKRLSERLADKLNEHGERITRLEERRFR